MRSIIIPKGSEMPFKRVLLNAWCGLDAIELKDGTYHIEEWLFKLLPKDFKITINEEEKILTTELAKYPIKDLKILDYKITCETIEK